MLVNQYVTTIHKRFFSLLIFSRNPTASRFCLVTSESAINNSECIVVVNSSPFPFTCGIVLKECAISENEWASAIDSTTSERAILKEGTVCEGNAVTIPVVHSSPDRRTVTGKDTKRIGLLRRPFCDKWSTDLHPKLNSLLLPRVGQGTLPTLISYP